jgi:hypothetical protein
LEALDSQDILWEMGDVSSIFYVDISLHWILYSDIALFVLTNPVGPMGPGPRPTVGRTGGRTGLPAGSL